MKYYYPDGEECVLSASRVEVLRQSVQKRWDQSFAFRKGLLQKVYEMPTDEMSLFFLKVGRLLRQELGVHTLDDLQSPTYNRAFLFLPLLVADRLGVPKEVCSRFEQEVLQSDVLKLQDRGLFSDENFRIQTGICIQNAAISSHLQAKNPDLEHEQLQAKFPWVHRLEWSVLDGNILALGLDRICPPTDSDLDFCAKSIMSPDRRWSPAYHERREQAEDRSIDYALIEARDLVHREMVSEWKERENVLENEECAFSMS